MNKVAGKGNIEIYNTIAKGYVSLTNYIKKFVVIVVLIIFHTGIVSLDVTQMSNLFI